MIVLLLHEGILASFTHFIKLFLFAFFALFSVAFLPVMHHKFLLLLLELLNVLLREFSHERTLLPNSHRRHSISLCCEHSSPMLSAFVPLACVNAAIGPLESTLSVFHVIEEIALVLATIGP